MLLGVFVIGVNPEGTWGTTPKEKWSEEDINIDVPKFLLDASDVNKDWTCKDEDKDKDQAYKDQDKDKDFTYCKLQLNIQ